MNNTFKFSCVIGTTDSACPLGLEIWLDDSCLLDVKHVQQDTVFEHHVLDDDAEHSLRFVLKGKKPEHTQISDSGEILSDATVFVKDLCFEEIALGHVFNEKTTYSHDFNGNGPAVQERFYGTMGCNGTAELKFQTPVYLWLLENM